MPVTIITNIKALINTREAPQMLMGKDMSILPSIENAYLLIEDGVISSYGSMEELPASFSTIHYKIDAINQFVLPGWCDSHSHLVFAGSREDEFVDKVKGLGYAEIAARGGGILNSAAKLQNTSEDELFNLAWARLAEVARFGTCAIEIKSGYGLTVESELKMLRVIKRLKQKSSLTIRSTFLAHAYPLQYQRDHEGYINLIINELLPIIAKDKLADFVDVFCEKGFFSPSEMEQVCAAGAAIGLKPKIHTNQLNSIGGIQAGIYLKAISMDHLETLTTADLTLLSSWKGICTVLPGAAYFLGLTNNNARQLIDQENAVAIASDFNPGSCPSGNMNLVIAQSCIQMKLLPEEAINAATLNGAYAMQVQSEAGSITIGKKANLIFTKAIPSIAYLPYYYGQNLIEKVMVNGNFI